MMRRAVQWVLVGLCAFAWVGCRSYAVEGEESNAPYQVVVEEGQPFSLKLEETALLPDGILMTFSSRFNSRCPNLNACVDPGTALVKFILRGNRVQPFEVEGYLPPEGGTLSRVIAHYIFEVNRLSPYPTTEENILVFQPPRVQMVLTQILR